MYVHIPYHGSCCSLQCLCRISHTSMSSSPHYSSHVASVCRFPYHGISYLRCTFIKHHFAHIVSVYRYIYYQKNSFSTSSFFTFFEFYVFLSGVSCRNYFISSFWNNYFARIRVRVMEIENPSLDHILYLPIVLSILLIYCKSLTV